MGLINDVKQKLRGLFVADSEGYEMESRQSDNRTVRRRYKRAAEQIYGNSSLRDELTDEQATRLLDWGNRFLKKAAGETADLADDEADNLLDKKTEQVSNVMRQVNQLTKLVARGEQQGMTDNLQALRQDLGVLMNASEKVSTNVEQMPSLQGEDRDQVFEKLMTMLDEEEE